MSKNNNSTIKVDSKEDFVRIYQHVTFGEKVEVFGKKAVVTGFEKFDDGMCAKVYYEDGGFDFINRDDLETEMEKVIAHDDEDGLGSACCGANVVNDICLDCKEHSGLTKE